MRRHSMRLLFPAAVAAAALLAFAPVTFAEEGPDEISQADTQDSPSDVPDTPPSNAKSLHSIPEDNLLFQNATGPDSALIRRLIAARPGEDIVICVAGCFTERDRVVYAQPAEKKAPKPVASVERKPADPGKQAALTPAPPSVSSVMPAAKSVDPKSPTIINADPGQSATP